MASVTGRRTVLLVVLAGLLGVGMGVVGAALARSGGGPSSGVRVQSAADIVVLDDLPGHEDPEPVDRVLDLVDARLRLQVRAEDDAVLTVGVAPADEVDAWLADTAHARATWVDDEGTLATRDVTGADAVSDGQPAWLDLQSGAEVDVTWAPEAGSVVTVILGGGAAGGVDATVGVGLDRRLLLLLAIVVAVGAVVVVADLVSSTKAALGGTSRNGHPPTDAQRSVRTP